MRFTAVLVCAVVLVPALGCRDSAVTWSDPVPLTSVAGASRLAIDSSGAAHLVADSIATAGLEADACRTSVRRAMGSRHEFAAWWKVRPDSSAILYVARMPDETGGTRAIPMDTVDRSTVGCARPAPSLAAVGDDVFVAYSMVAPEGKGVFFAHTMGGMVHAPVSVIYGERLVNTAIAAEGDRVLVAYEEPNGSRQQVDLAMSSTQGHIFEWRGSASRDIDVALMPMVALAGSQIAVSWLVPGRDSTAATRVVRVGRLQPSSKS